MNGIISEISYYGFLAVVCLLLAIKGTREKSTAMDILMILLVVGLSIVSRRELHSDMMNYRDTIQGLSEYGFSFDMTYYLKEFFFWYPSYFCTRYLFSGNVLYTFYLWDLCTVLLLLSVRRKRHWPYYMVLLFYVSFYGVLGLQNILRQFVAGIILWKAISEKNFILGGCWLLLAAGIHNSIVIFAPIYLIARSRFGIKTWVLLLIMVGAASVIVLFMPKKEMSTGMDMSMVYLLVVLAMVIGNYVLLRRNHEKLKYSAYLQTLLFIAMLGCIVLVVLGHTLYYERIMITNLYIIVPMTAEIIVLAMKSVFRRKAADILLALLFIAPTFLFSAPHMMLVNAPILFE